MSLPTWRALRSTAPSRASSCSTWAASFSSAIPMGPSMRPFRNCRTTGSSLVSSFSRGPNMTSSRRNNRPMLSGTWRAEAMSCVTIRKVALICALRSTMSWFRYATRTGSRPESGSSNRMISGSRTNARARPARLRIPPEISPGSFSSEPIRPTMSIFSSTIRRIWLSDLRVCSRSGKAMLSYRLIDPNSAPSWNSTPNSFRTS